MNARGEPNTASGRWGTINIKRQLGLEPTAAAAVATKNPRVSSLKPSALSPQPQASGLSLSPTLSPSSGFLAGRFRRDGRDISRSRCT